MTKLVVGNWKMNGSRALVETLVGDLAARHQDGKPKAAVVLCPPAHLLAQVALTAGSGLALGAQDCSAEAGPGAFTGEISASMLQEVGCRYVIVGHSERRARHGESDATVKTKAEQALAVGLIPIVCVGETLAERESGEAVAVVRRQVAGSLPAAVMAGQGLVVAYEPVWAIGTGKTATPEDVKAMHGEIRALVTELHPTGATLPLLYGGSVKPDNAAELLSQPNVDGALVGGASLKAGDFWAIVEAAG